MGLKQLSFVDFGAGELTTERGMISCEAASLQKPRPNKNHAQLQPQMSMQPPLLPQQQGASFSFRGVCVSWRARITAQSSHPILILFPGITFKMIGCWFELCLLLPLTILDINQTPYSSHIHLFFELFLLKKWGVGAWCFSPTPTLVLSLGGIKFCVSTGLWSYLVF